MTTVLLLALTAFPIEFDGGRIDAPGFSPQVITLRGTTYLLWLQEGHALEPRASSTTTVWAAPIDISSSSRVDARRLCDVPSSQKARLVVAANDELAIGVWDHETNVGKLTLSADGGVTCSRELSGVQLRGPLKLALSADAGLLGWTNRTGGRVEAAFFPPAGPIGTPFALAGFGEPFDLAGGTRLRAAGVTSDGGGFIWSDLAPGDAGGSSGVLPSAFALDTAGNEVLGLFGSGVERRTLAGMVTASLGPGPASSFVSSTVPRVDVIGSATSISVRTGAVEIPVAGRSPTLAVSASSSSRLVLAYEVDAGIQVGSFVQGNSQFLRLPVPAVSSFRGGATVAWDWDKWMVALERWDDRGVETAVIKVTTGGEVNSVTGLPGIHPLALTDPIAGDGVVTTTINRVRTTTPSSFPQVTSPANEVGSVVFVDTGPIHYESDWVGTMPRYVPSNASIIGATATQNRVVLVERSTSGDTRVLEIDASTGAVGWSSQSWTSPAVQGPARIGTLRPGFHLVGIGSRWWLIVNGPPMQLATLPGPGAVSATGTSWVRAWSEPNGVFVQRLFLSAAAALDAGMPISVDAPSNALGRFGPPELAVNPAGEVAVVWTRWTRDVPSLHMTVVPFPINVGPADAGVADGGRPDAGRPADAGAPPDAGGPDAGMDAGAEFDAGADDGGAAGDAGTVDAGLADAGTMDAGLPDAGALDGGAPGTDAGVADAGPPPLDSAPDAGEGPGRDVFTPVCGCGSVDGLAALLALLVLSRRRRAT